MLPEPNTKPSAFTNAFDPTIWGHKDLINYLESNILKIESVIAKYLDNITIDFPQLTDHSITHSKMLWKYASIIIGDSERYINPLEAFVLHAAFLIHDAGMSYSVLNNKEKIEEDPIYTDYIKRYGQTEDLEREALFYTIRYRHGDFALWIATTELKDGEFLIEDLSIREELGEIIGKIAKSHTYNVSFIEREFSSKYHNPKFPIDWGIDCQKIAFLLRVCDAAHVDNLRTPKSVRMISEIGGISQDHWTFQKKLGFPALSTDGLLQYNTNTPFTAQEQKAWWYCYDALYVLDKELKNANSYFVIHGQEGFAAKGVKAINDTLELGEHYVRTSGWTSIDTKVKVTNPIHIAAELGGVKLYGNINVAIRELIQNSIDAINLFRSYTGAKNYGEISVSIQKEANDYYLVVLDNGIGMSQSLMTNELLDFGGSYWKSNMFNYDFEGIRTQGFESIGKFGIGFFSVFMLGKVVTVTSWRYGEAIGSMKTLDFYDGLYSNPILRSPNQAERASLIDKGTCIRIRLDTDPYSKLGFIGSSNFKQNKLYTLVKFFIPFPNVKILTIEQDGEKNSIEPKNLPSLDTNEFIDMIYNPSNDQHTENLVNNFKSMNLKLIEVSEGDKLYGKLSLVPYSRSSLGSISIILSNGIRVSGLGDLAGYMITDEIISVRRDQFAKNVPYEVMKEWAIKQVAELRDKGLTNRFLLPLWGMLMTFELYQDDDPIALRKNNGDYTLVSINELRQYLRANSEVVFFQEGNEREFQQPTCEGFVKYSPRFSVGNIIRQEDQEKILTVPKLLAKILDEEWGGVTHEQENFYDKGYYMDQPYTIIDTYKRREFSTPTSI